MAKALARWFVQKAKLEDFDSSGGKTPPALLAIDRLERVVAIGERCLKIEASLGAISHAELKAFLDIVAETLHRFVPAEREAQAREFMRVRIRAREQIRPIQGRQRIAQGRAARHPRRRQSARQQFVAGACVASAHVEVTS
ncbi:MAG TPA: hypothetical protein VEB21_20345 [Terriglobales bacterium]|nr:hypothetical protein [Terriglobales bacterium]